MKWSPTLAASVLALSAQASSATSLPPCPSTSHLVDTISAVGGKTAKIMSDRLAKLDRETTDQIIALTIDDKGKYGYGSMREFGLAYFEACKVGSKATDRGVLVTYEKNGAKYTIETSRGLEGPIPDIDTRNKVFESAKLQCKNLSPGCILDKSTLALEKILKQNPFVPSPQATHPSELRKSAPVASPKMPPIIGEDSGDMESDMMVGGIMLTSFLAGLGLMGIRRGLTRGFTPSRGIVSKRNDDIVRNTIKKDKEEIKRLKSELIAEGYILGKLPPIDNKEIYYERVAIKQVLEMLLGVRGYYQGLSTFVRESRTSYGEKIVAYQKEKEKHDAIYGATTDAIDMDGLKSAFFHSIEEFTSAYSKKDIPKLQGLGREVVMVLGEIDHATNQYSQTIELYTRIPKQIETRRENISGIEVRDTYVQAEKKYRLHTGDHRFQGYKMSEKITELRSILDMIDAAYQTKRNIGDVPNLIRKFDDTMSMLVEYMRLGSKLRDIREEEDRAQRRAERNRQDELTRVRGAAATGVAHHNSGSGNTFEERSSERRDSNYGSVPERGNSSDDRVPDRGGASSSGGGSEITIESVKDDSGRDAGMGSATTEDS